MNILFYFYLDFITDFNQNHYKDSLSYKRNTFNYPNIHNNQFDRNLKSQFEFRNENYINTLSNYTSNPNLVLNNFEKDKNHFNNQSQSTIDLNSFEREQVKLVNRKLWRKKKKCNEKLRRTKHFNAFKKQTGLGHLKDLPWDSTSEYTDEVDYGFAHKNNLVNNCLRKKHDDDNYSWCSTSTSSDDSDESYEKWDNWSAIASRKNFNWNNNLCSTKSQSNSNCSRVIFMNKKQLHSEYERGIHCKNSSVKRNCIIM